MKKWIFCLSCIPIYYLSSSPDYPYVSSLGNCFRAVLMVHSILVDYSSSLSPLPYNSQQYHQARSAAHYRTARAILSLSEQNKGIYLKLGQYLGTLSGVVPPQFPEVLSKLQDSVTPVEYHAIRSILSTNDKTTKLEQVYEIEEYPIAAASLAQVHIGHNRVTNEKVAIKMQYPFLVSQSKVDIFVLTYIIRAINSYMQYYKEYECDLMKVFSTWTNTLIDELDFTNQLRNAQRCRTDLLLYPYCTIPRYIPQYCSERVLVMEYIEGTKISDIATIIDMGIDPKTIAHTLAQVMNTMLFKNRFVHCDAHDGNILVRRAQNDRRHQVVLLDHGLYKSFNQTTIQSFSNLLVSIVENDETEMKKQAKALNMHHHLEYLPLIFMGRVKGSRRNIGETMSIEERKELRRKDMGNFDAINQILRDLPDQLGFIIKASLLVRIHFTKLGGTRREWIFQQIEHAMRVKYTNPWMYAIAYVVLYVRVWLMEHIVFPLYKVWI